MSFPIKIKYDSISLACKLKLHFPPCVHSSQTLSAACCIYTSFYKAARCLVCWVASISTVCIPLHFSHEGITFSPLPHFLPLLIYLTKMQFHSVSLTVEIPKCHYTKQLKRKSSSLQKSTSVRHYESVTGSKEVT